MWGTKARLHEEGIAESALSIGTEVMTIVSYYVGHCSVWTLLFFSLCPSLSPSCDLFETVKHANLNWCKKQGIQRKNFAQLLLEEKWYISPQNQLSSPRISVPFSLKRLLLTANQAYRVLDISSLRFNTKAPKRTLHLRTLSWAGQDGKTMTWSIGFSNFPPDRKVSQIPHLFRPIPQAIPPASTKSQGTYCPGRGGSWYLRCIQMAFCPSWNVWKLVFLFQMVFWDVTV